MKEPLPINRESQTEARSFLAQAKYSVKHGKPLAETLSDIRDKDIGAGGEDEYRAEVLKNFNELIKENRPALLALEKEAAAKGTQEKPAAVPAAKKRKAIDPLVSVREARPEEMEEGKPDFLGLG